MILILFRPDHSVRRLGIVRDIAERAATTRVELPGHRSRVALGSALQFDIRSFVAAATTQARSDMDHFAVSRSLVGDSNPDAGTR